MVDSYDSSIDLRLWAVILASFSYLNIQLFVTSVFIPWSAVHLKSGKVLCPVGASIWLVQEKNNFIFMPPDALKINLQYMQAFIRYNLEPEVGHKLFKLEASILKFY